MSTTNTTHTRTLSSINSTNTPNLLLVTHIITNTNTNTNTNVSNLLIPLPALPPRVLGAQDEAECEGRGEADCDVGEDDGMAEGVAGGVG